jgi:hypothetical protein
MRVLVDEFSVSRSVERSLAEARSVAVRPVDTSRLMLGLGEVGKVSRMLAEARSVAVRPVDTSRLMRSMVEALETAMVVTAAAADGGVASAAVVAPGSAPLFPGLANPWQQIRHWDLQDWITFITLILTAVGIVLTVEQERFQSRIGPEELERITRIIQQSGGTTTTVVPTTSSPPSTSKSPQQLKGDKDGPRTGRGSTTRGSG